MIKLGKLYNQFQHSYGQSVSLDYDNTVKSLFSANFKKIANGIELVSGAQNLLIQLNEVKKSAGLWTIDVIDTIPSLCNQKLTISYILNSEKLGKFGIIAIINSSDGEKIDQVNEVYYQF